MSKSATTDKPAYRFDENGALAPEKDEEEAQRFLRESIALYKEGFSSNHPYDVALSNDPENEPSPETLDIHGRKAKPNETEEERIEREKEQQEERSEYSKKGMQKSSMKGTTPNPDRKDPPKDPHDHPDEEENVDENVSEDEQNENEEEYNPDAGESEESQANDAVDPSFSRPTPEDKRQRFTTRRPRK